VTYCQSKALQGLRGKKSTTEAMEYFE